MVRLWIQQIRGRPKILVKIDKSFPVTASMTRRVLEVSHAFGIDIDEERKHTIYSGFMLEINPGDIIYITGESGSGKSVLLREISGILSRRREFGGVVMDRELMIDDDEVIIEGIGRDTSEAIEILNSVGLGEAFLFLKRYIELSDGQKYRYQLAKALCMGRKTIAMDEFCSTLDRDTAKVVAYLFQKYVRRNGMTLIAATTHRDLLEDLRPTVLVEKKLGPDVNVSYYTWQDGPCSLMKEITIEPGDLSDYEALSGFHYRGRKPPCIAKIYRAVRNGELCGVIVYVSAITHPLLRGRHIVFPQLLEIYRTRGLKKLVEVIKRNILRIARVVVYPKYRGIGLGTRLVRETMPLTEYPVIEALAVMARYNPFFERAGLRRISYDTSLDEQRRRLIFRLQEEFPDLDAESISEPSYISRYVENLSIKRLKKLVKIVSKTLTQPPTKLRKNTRKIRTRKELVKMLLSLRLPPIYYVWKNPAKKPEWEE